MFLNEISNFQKMPKTIYGTLILSFQYRKRLFDYQQDYYPTRISTIYSKSKKNVGSSIVHRPKTNTFEQYEYFNNVMIVPYFYFKVCFIHRYEADKSWQEYEIIFSNFKSFYVGHC